MHKIISWNVASLRARMPALLKLLETYNPNILLLQEIKCVTENFPFFDLQTQGYQCYISGQKAYNGVAILSKTPLTDIQTELPGFIEPGDTQARFIQATDENGIIYISVYVPNGNPPMKDPADTSKLQYKLAWLEALIVYIKKLVHEGKKVVLGGDFNVIAADGDVYNPDAYRTNALMLPSVQKKFHDLSALALVNTLREYHPEPGLYSFWDFQMGAWHRNWGMLLDYIFLSENLTMTLTNSDVIKEVRGWEKTSDHAPIYCDLEI